MVNACWFFSYEYHKYFAWELARFIPQKKTFISIKHLFDGFCAAACICFFGNADVSRVELIPVSMNSVWDIEFSKEKFDHPNMAHVEWRTCHMEMHKTSSDRLLISLKFWYDWLFAFLFVREGRPGGKISFRVNCIVLWVSSKEWQN